ncbi:carboxylesterase/lipase family protein [Leifsonia poae]|uniref:carboxylesterase/lipase family protein n=1 Tax=Leifsonia poae TaxID=110933 RepID=UPI001CC16738|nr:carboxylesterase/lipase family protein [Leifsonia poae]
MDAARAVDDTVVVTRGGVVRGRDDGRAISWKGIRYARPPVGALRWRAPVEAEPWAQPLDAVTFGAASPQRPNPAVPLGPDTVMDEDCLFLNVWRPAAPAEDARPVMVWIHGGAYTFGSASQPLFNGTTLVADGDVVLVTINYRTGALGFLDLTGHATPQQPFDSNLALRDVLLALAWVRDNIAAFGGDPERVTVFGESAGGGILTALLATDAASGLFHRAIIESSPATSMYGTDRSRTVADRFLAAAGVSTDEVDRLRTLNVEAIVDAAMTVYADIPSEFPGTLAFAPVIDGELLREAPITALRNGRGLPVPLLIGTNKDEATLFKFMKSPLMPIKGEAIDTMFENMRADNPGLEAPTREQVLDAYETVRHRTLGLGIATDIGFRMPTVWLAEGHSRVAPTYLYRFDFTTPMLKLIGIGAAHATELPYVWGNLTSAPKDPTFKLGGYRAGVEVSKRIRARWTGFAHGGEPDAPGSPWPAFDEGSRATLTVGRADRVVDDLDRELRGGWGDRVLAFR